MYAIFIRSKIIIFSLAHLCHSYLLYFVTDNIEYKITTAGSHLLQLANHGDGEHLLNNCTALFLWQCIKNWLNSSHDHCGCNFTDRLVVSADIFWSHASVLFQVYSAHSGSSVLWTLFQRFKTHQTVGNKYCFHLQCTIIDTAHTAVLWLDYFSIIYFWNVPEIEIGWKRQLKVCHEIIVNMYVLSVR